jgi:ubiquinone/menaquinone biosynthesis C-methylase UbiE
MTDVHLPESLDTVARAFSKVAGKYDQFGDDHPHLTRMRHKVYRHLMRHVPPGSSILELNSGSGTDAVYLAQRGYRVHATDIAPGMLQRLEDKVERFGLGEQLTAQTCSFSELEQVTGGPFDAVFSDLGGLNCAPSLTPIIDKLPLVLRAGGVVTWVLMPPVCLWELALVFTGKLRLAFRRLSSQGTLAHLEGFYFPVYYFTPRQAMASFGPEYELLSIEGLSVITPTAESKNLARRFRRVYGTLAWLDDRLSPRWPWRAWGDFYVISLRYRP